MIISWGLIKMWIFFFFLGGGALQSWTIFFGGWGRGGGSSLILYIFSGFFLRGVAEFKIFLGISNLFFREWLKQQMLCHSLGNMKY